MPTWETPLRLGCFVGVLAVMSVWEALAPHHPRLPGNRRRRVLNLGLMTMNTMAARICLPLSAVAAARFAESHRYGLLNRWAAPDLAEALIAITALDFVIYLQHVLFHRVPILRGLHAVHHSDSSLDATTGVRFHTIEILLSALLKTIAVIALGASVPAVVAFEIILNGMAMMNHSNVRFPQKLESVLRWLIVTPAIHSVHHSSVPVEANSNFGFSLSCWDRLLKTYLPPEIARADSPFHNSSPNGE